MLDQQVVRAALKAFDALAVRKTRTTNDLTPSTAYLRHLLAPPPPSAKWDDPQTAITLLEQRAALMVRDRALHLREPDASMDQRVSRAVTDAFVAAQVGEIIRTLEADVGQRNAGVLRKLYNLVRVLSHRARVLF